MPPRENQSFRHAMGILMFGKHRNDNGMPMSLPSDHPAIPFSYYRPDTGRCVAEIWRDRP